MEFPAAYFKELGDPKEAEKFFDHFEANGWKVGGKTPMKDWKAAARNWMRSPYRNAGKDKSQLRREGVKRRLGEIDYESKGIPRGNRADKRSISES